jgi:uroporphyrinogen decarboxylase
MRNFSPDYTHIQKAAFNQPTERLPLYEHAIATEIMEAVLGRKFKHLYDGNNWDKLEYFTAIGEFYKTMGYDSISYECCFTQAMPGSGCLSQQDKEPPIKNYDDFKKYPWDEIPDMFFNMFGESMTLFKEVIPPGMKLIGGVGNGVFEGVQDIVGYHNLCLISHDDPELYAGLFQKCGELMAVIWEKFLSLYGNMFCVLRMGDDLGFKNSTLLSPADIRKHVIPVYKKIAVLIHKYKKPFLFHSCGNIFDIMPDLIMKAGIDAKHSNEDLIAPFSEWVKKYGNAIGNFGGIDLDLLCRLSVPEIPKVVRGILDSCPSLDGVAFSTGNSVPDYVPVEKYTAMVESVRVFRGE